MTRYRRLALGCENRVQRRWVEWGWRQHGTLTWHSLVQYFHLLGRLSELVVFRLVWLVWLACPWTCECQTRMTQRWRAA